MIAHNRTGGERGTIGRRATALFNKIQRYSCLVLSVAPTTQDVRMRHAKHGHSVSQKRWKKFHQIRQHPDSPKYAESTDLDTFRRK